MDLGAHGYDKDDDYPDFARYVGQAIQHGQADRGVLVCGSGVGASVAANKMKGVRAAVCHETYSAGQGVEHDDMNVLCLGGRIIGPTQADQLVRAFLGTNYTGEERGTSAGWRRCWRSKSLTRPLAGAGQVAGAYSGASRCASTCSEAWSSLSAISAIDEQSRLNVLSQSDRRTPPEAASSSRT